MADTAEPDWIRVQRKVFTRWCNSHLVQVDIFLENLENDLSDGYAIHQLVTLLSKRSLGKAIKNPQSDFQRAQNLNLALDCLTKKENVKLVNISAEDIIRKNTKIDLGLIWTLIIKYQISRAEYNDDSRSGPKGLLMEWVNRILGPQDIHVKDFTSCWQDGKAFSGLVNAIEPNTIDLSKLDLKEREDNLNNAFTVSNDNFGIAQLLDASDVVSSPDEISIMSYVSLFRKYISQFTPSPIECYASGEGLERAAEGRKATFVVYTVNNGARITRGGANVSSNIVVKEGEVIDVLVSDELDGSYKCEYSVDLPGSCELNVLVNGAPIKDSPFHPEVCSVSAHAANTIAYGPGLESAHCNDLNTFTIKAVDVNGDDLKLGGAKFVSFVKNKGKKRNNIPVNITDNDNGLYSASYQPSKVGNIEVHVLLETKADGNVHIKGSPFDVSVSNANGPLTVKLDGAGTESAVAGEKANFHARIEDSDGNCCADDDISFHMDGPEKIDVSVNRIGEGADLGTFNAFYIPQKAGKYKLSSSINGNKVESPCLEVVVSPGAADPMHTSVDLDREIKAGAESDVKISTKDKFGNKIVEGGAKIVPTVVNQDGEVIPLDLIDKDDGEYSVKFKPTKSGDYKLNIKLNDEHVKDSPFDIKVSPSELDLNKITSSASGVEKIVAGEKGEFQVLTFDSFGNQLNNGGNNVFAEFNGPEDVKVDVKDNNDGSYGCSLVPVKSGNYKLSIKVNDTKIPGSPYDISVIPSSASPENTIIEPNHLDKCTVGEKFEFKVRVHDKYNNEIGCGGDEIEAVVEHDEKVLETPVNITDNGDGKYDLEVPPFNQDRVYKLKVNLNGSPIKDSPLVLNVLPMPEVSVDNSYVTGVKDAVAGTKQEILINFLDQFGNKILGDVKADFKIKGNDDINVEIIDNKDGTCKAVYTPTKIGKYKTYTSVNGKKLKKNPIAFNVRHAKVSPLNTIASGTGIQKAKSNKRADFVVQLRDIFDNPIDNNSFNAIVTSSIELLSGSTQKYSSNDLGNQIDSDNKDHNENLEPIEIDIADNKDGTFNCNYTIKKAGEYKLSVFVNGDHVSKSPFSVNGKPGKLHIPNTVVRIPPNVKAGKNGPRIYLMDENKNLRHKGKHDLNVKFNKKSTSSLKVQDMDDGAYTVEIPSNYEGEYDIEVFLGDQAIPQSKFKSSIESNPLEIEDKKSIESVLPDSAPIILELLNKVSESDRKKFVNELLSLDPSKSSGNISGASNKSLDHSGKDQDKLESSQTIVDAAGNTSTGAVNVAHGKKSQTKESSPTKSNSSSGGFFRSSLGKNNDTTKKSSEGKTKQKKVQKKKSKN